MAALQGIGLQLPASYLAQVKSLLKQHVPRAEVWAYGSRVGGTGHQASDLDLVVRNLADLKQETPTIMNLKEAFIESDLPIRVDVLDWARIPDDFRHEIERAHVVIRKGTPVHAALE